MPKNYGFRPETYRSDRLLVSYDDTATAGKPELRQTKSRTPEAKNKKSPLFSYKKRAFIKMMSVNKIE